MRQSINDFYIFECIPEFLYMNLYENFLFNSLSIYNIKISGFRRKVKPLERYIPREFRENRDWNDMFDLIKRMLEYDPVHRITLPQAMEHPFLEKIALRKPSRSSSGYASR